MSKEWLEEIKRMWHEDGDIDDKAFYWLIEQAERVQELEETVEDYKTVNKELHQRGRKVRNQNKRYREALEFYADEKSWMNRKVTILMDGEPTDVEDCPAIFDDGGNIARQALKG